MKTDLLKARKIVFIKQNVLARDRRSSNLVLHAKSDKSDAENTQFIHSLPPFSIMHHKQLSFTLILKDTRIYKLSFTNKMSFIKGLYGVAFNSNKRILATV